MLDQPKISARCLAGNANHHLWNNNGTWWCHFTIHLADYTKLRLRRSLGTRSAQEAREIRDFLIAVLPAGDRAAAHLGDVDNRRFDRFPVTGVTLFY